VVSGFHGHEHSNCGPLGCDVVGLGSVITLNVKATIQITTTEVWNYIKTDISAASLTMYRMSCDTSQHSVFGKS